jgi:hypothetical protein
MFDADASTYIEAVEVADTQALETAVRYAINDFVIGCKQDGIWNAIKASCILAGARTLAGALMPLAGAAPTNVSGLFVAGDYIRKTGLKQSGSKYLAANRNNNVDPQNNKHFSAFYSETPNISTADLGAGYNVSGASSLGRIGSTVVSVALNSSAVANVPTGPGNLLGFMGSSRSTSASIDYRFFLAGALVSGSHVSNSAAPLDSGIDVFRVVSGGTPIYSGSRLAFYSIGESLNLAALDTRVSTLITAFGAAIP